jgi:hypothetical protein
MPRSKSGSSTFLHPAPPPPVVYLVNDDGGLLSSVLDLSSHFQHSHAMVIAQVSKLESTLVVHLR